LYLASIKHNVKSSPTSFLGQKYSAHTALEGLFLAAKGTPFYYCVHEFNKSQTGEKYYIPYFLTV